MGQFMKTNISGAKIAIRVDITMETGNKKQISSSQRKKMQEIKDIYEKLHNSNIITSNLNFANSEDFLKALQFKLENETEILIVKETLENSSKFFSFRVSDIAAFINARHFEIKEYMVRSALKKVVAEFNYKFATDEIKIKSISDFILFYNYSKEMSKKEV